MILCTNMDGKFSVIERENDFATIIFSKSISICRLCGALNLRFISRSQNDLW